MASSVHCCGNTTFWIKHQTKVGKYIIALDWNAQALTSGWSTHRRSSSSSTIPHHTAWVDEHATQLVQLAFAAIRAQHNRTATRAVSEVITAALHTSSPALLRALSGALVKTAATPQHTLPGQALVYVRWTSQVLVLLEAGMVDKVQKQGG